MKELKQKLVISLLVCNLIFTIISIIGVGYLVYKQISRGHITQNFPRQGEDWIQQGGKSSNQ
jgi:threonine/homoserine/homoserine lactone efflux protein